MFKLNQLKRTFVKNNRNRRYLREYFGRFAKEGKVGVEELKDLVNEYGYDISDEEAKLIIRLTGAKNKLNLNEFIELMSRDNIHFSTLKIEGST
jgi:Ca2+-binding EF-hand superfamily protein